MNEVDTSSTPRAAQATVSTDGESTSLVAASRPFSAPTAEKPAPRLPALFRRESEGFGTVCSYGDSMNTACTNTSPSKRRGRPEEQQRSHSTAAPPLPSLPHPGGESDMDRVFAELRSMHASIASLRDTIEGQNLSPALPGGHARMPFDGLSPRVREAAASSRTKVQDLLRMRRALSTMTRKRERDTKGINNWRRTAVLTANMCKHATEQKDDSPCVPVSAVVLAKEPPPPPPEDAFSGDDVVARSQTEVISRADGARDASWAKLRTGARAAAMFSPAQNRTSEDDKNENADNADAKSSTSDEGNSKGKGEGKDKKGKGDKAAAVVNPLKVRAGDESTLFPNGLHKTMVDMVTLFAIFAELVMISWLLCVVYDGNLVFYQVTIGLLTPIHAYWIHTNFRTAFLKGWILTDQSDAIKVAYLKGWFVFDLFVTIPWDLFASFFDAPTVFRVFIAIRLLRTIRVPWLLLRSNPVQDQPVWVEVALISFWSVAFLHFCTCSWLLIATSEDQGFLDTDDMETDRFAQYLAALYWACATISSTGYGDINSKSQGARVLASVWMWAGVFIIVYAGAKVTQWMVIADPFILAEMDKKRQLYALMTHNNIPWKIQKSALAVYPVVLETSSHDYNSIIDELPRFLQDQIRLHVKLKLIKKVPIFKGVSDDCLVAVAQVTIPEFYALDANVIEYGEQGSEMFFLEHGIVEIYTYDEAGAEIWMANLKGGSFFGEISLMSEDCRRTATVRAVTSCIMYTLTKESFDHVVQVYPDLKRKVETEARARLEDIKMNIAMIERMKKATRMLMLQPSPGDTNGKKLWKKVVLQVILNRTKEETAVATATKQPSTPTGAVQEKTCKEEKEESAPQIGTFIEPIAYHPHIRVEAERADGEYAPQRKVSGQDTARRRASEKPVVCGVRHNLSTCLWLSWKEIHSVSDPHPSHRRTGVSHLFAAPRLSHHDRMESTPCDSPPPPPPFPSLTSTLIAS